MKKIVAYVNSVSGKYHAFSSEGETRLLKTGDPIYEGDAVFSQNEGQEGAYIDLLYSNGETISLTDASYFLADAGVAGEQDTDNPSGLEQASNREYVDLTGRVDGENTQSDVPAPTYDNVPSDGLDGNIINYVSEENAEPVLQSFLLPPPIDDSETPQIPQNSSVNHPPRTADSDVTGIEDTKYVFKIDDFKYSDANGDKAVSVRVDSFPLNGKIFYKGTVVEKGTIIPLTDIEKGELTFLPNPDDNGQNYTSFEYSVNDGKVFSPSPGNMIIHIIPVDDPTLFKDIGNQVYTEKNPAVILDSSITLEDVDSDITSATIKIENVQEGDVLWFTGKNGIEGVYNVSTGTLTLTGKASPEDYKAALESVKYHSTSSNPTVYDDVPQREVTWTVTDEHGNTQELHSIIDIIPINDPSILSEGNATMTEGENGVGELLEAEGKLTIEDPDNPEKFKPLTDVEGDYGKFSIDEDGNWSFISNSPYTELNEGDQLTESFEVESIDGTKTKVTVVINGVDNGTVFKDIGNQVYTEKNPAVILDSSITLEDVDSDITSATIKIENVQDGDVLGFNAPEGSQIVGSYDPETGTLTLTGKASPEDYKTALESVKYHSTSSNPTVYDEVPEREVTWTVTDEHENTQELNSIIDITPINDPATLSEGNATMTEGENGVGELLEAEGKLTIEDPDNPEKFKPLTDIEGDYGKFSIDEDGNWSFISNSPYTELNEGDQLTEIFEVESVDGTKTKVTVVINGVGTPVVIENLDSQTYIENGLAKIIDSSISLVSEDPDALLSGAIVKIENLLDGDILGFNAPEGSQVVGIYDPETGTLTFTGNASVDDYNAILESVTYKSASDDPTSNTTREVVNLKWSIVDEYGKLVSETSTITITPLTDNPVVVSTAETDVYVGIEKLINTDISISDVDDTHLSEAEVKIDNYKPGDVLNYDSDLANGYGIELVSNENGILKLSGNATIEQYEEVLRSVSFKGSETGDRNISWEVSDANSDDAGVGVGSGSSVVSVNSVLCTPQEVELPKNADGTPIVINLPGEPEIITITELPINGTLYEDSGCTKPVEIDKDYPVDGGNTTFYFKPDYDPESPEAPYGPDKCDTSTPEIVYTTTKDGEPAGGSTVTLNIIDLPHAYEAEDKYVVEKDYNASGGAVTGNLISDGADHGTGKDYVTEYGAEVTQIKYLDVNGDEQTVSVGNSKTVETKEGFLTVNKDGSYSFSPKNLEHIDSDEITCEFSYQLKAKNTDALSNWATQKIIVTDGADPSIGTPDNETLSEASLPGGTEANPDGTEVSGSLSVTGGSDSYKVTFKENPETYLPTTLKSRGEPVVYELSEDGTTITAKAGGEVVFTVDITNQTGDAGYQFNLKSPLDGPSDYDFDFEFIVTDKDGDTAESSFKITVENDAPTSRDIEMNEDNSYSFSANADATQENTSIKGSDDSYVKTFTTDKGGTVTVKEGGIIEYVPMDNYSGEDSFTYVTVTEGEEKEVVVNVVVKPVADAPDWLEKNIERTTNEDTNITDFKLPLPIITDIDSASYERLGFIELAIQNTANNNQFRVETQDGDLVIKGGDSTVKIVLVDGAGEPLETYHHNGIIDEPGYGAAVKLTVEEYENLKFIPNPNDHRNVEFVVKTTSYELDAEGKATANKASSSTTIKVDVQAVTDPVTIAKVGADPVVNEDGWVRIDNLFNITSTDTDGSEKFTLHIDGGASLAGWQYNTKTGDSGAKPIGSDGKFNLPIGENHQIWVKPPLNNSTDVSGITAHVVAKDTDSDSNHTTSPVNSNELTFEIGVKSVADGVDINFTGSGIEHKPIVFGVTTDFKDKVSDGSHDKPEVLETVEIDFTHAVELGYTVFYADPDGNKDEGRVAVVLDGDNKLTVDHESSTNYNQKFYFEPTDGKSVDFNGKISIPVKTVTSQNEDDNPDRVDNKTYELRVIGKVDTIGGGYDDVNGSLGFKLGDDFVAKGVSLDTWTFNEDTKFKLNLSIESLEAEHDGSQDGSEEVRLIIKSLTDNVGFTVVDATGNKLGTAFAGGWLLTPTQVAQAHILPDKYYSGELKLELTTRVQDKYNGEIDHEYSQTNTITLNVTPVANEPDIAVREVFTKEDQGVLLDIRPIPSDTDGSEVPYSVAIGDIPVGAYFTINGVEVFKNDGSKPTFTIMIGSGDGKTSLEDLAKLTFHPPKDSNEDITLKITPVIRETGNDKTSAPVTIDVKVHVQGVADDPNITVSGSTDPLTITDGKTAEVTIEGVEDTPVKITIVAESGDGDSSEKISFLLGDVPDHIELVDSAGNALGVYMKDNKKWALTAEEMQKLHFKSNISDYSDQVKMSLYTVVTENDGDSKTIETPIVLNIMSVVDAGVGVIGAAVGKEDSLIFLNFNEPADPSEKITDIKIPTGSIDTEDFILVYKNGDTETEITANDGFYNITYAYTNGYQIALKLTEGSGYTHEHINGTISINDIVVTVVDSNDSTSGYTETASKEITGNMTITIDAVADKIEISGEAEVEASCFNYVPLNLSAEYPDDDGSEFHYFIIKGDGSDDWYLNMAATYNGDGTWYVSKDDLTSVKVAAKGSGEFELTVVGYSVEKSNGDTETSEKKITFKANEGSCPGNSEWKKAQTPLLVLKSATGMEDSDSLTLGDFVQSAELQNSDGGTEKLSLIIKDLPEGVSITSINPENISYYTDTDGKETVRINIAGDSVSSEDLLGYDVVVPEHFSGVVNFTIYAVATEYGASDVPQPPHTAKSATEDFNAIGIIMPVADGISANAFEMAGMKEDVPVQLKFLITSLDTHVDDIDHAETYDNVRISIENGSFLDENKNPLLGTNLNVNVDKSTGVVTTTDGKTVYVVSNENKFDPIKVTVTAATADTTAGYTSNASNQVAEFTLNVTAVADAAILTASNVNGDEDSVIQLDLEAVFEDDDGSELHSVKITGLPDGALIVDSAGALVGMNIGNGEWNITNLEYSSLHIQAPINYSGDLELKLVGYSIEKSNPSEIVMAEKSFVVSIDPVADGVVITPNNKGEGLAGEWIRPDGTTGFLEGALIETERTKESGLEHESGSDERYAVSFSGLSDDMSFGYQSKAGEWVEVDAQEGSLTIEKLTQAEFDSLSFKSITETGKIEIKASVWSQELDKNGNVADESSKEEATFSVKVEPNPDLSPDMGGFALFSTFGFEDNSVISLTDNHIDFGLISDSLHHVNQIDLLGTSSISNLSVSDFLNMDINSKTITINGDDDDSVSFKNGDEGDWNKAGSEGGYDIYTSGDLTVKVDTDITTHVG